MSERGVRGSRLAAGLALFALAATPLAAQQTAGGPGAPGSSPPAGFRQVQLADLERERAMTLAMVDSMPERLLHFRPVPVVRDFAQQIAHAAMPMAEFAAQATGQRPPNTGDSTVYLNSKAALREAVGRAYEYCIRALRGLSDPDYAGTTAFFGRQVPRWKIFEAAREHSVWTRGEVVVYFRLNGMAPPAFELFPMGSPVRR